MRPLAEIRSALAETHLAAGRQTWRNHFWDNQTYAGRCAAEAVEALAAGSAEEARRLMGEAVFVEAVSSNGNAWWDFDLFLFASSPTEPSDTTTD
jgi:hypothetical protein